MTSKTNLPKNIQNVVNTYTTQATHTALLIKGPKGY
jgi:hypothetical protein